MNRKTLSIFSIACFFPEVRRDREGWCNLAKDRNY